MIKKTITYPDLDGNKVSEDWYFHFNKAELIELELNKDVSGQLVKITEGKATPREAIELIRDLIVGAVGERSEDGKRFIKNADITANFTQSEAYSNLLMELVGNPSGAAAFINSLMPKDIEEVTGKLQASNELKLPEEKKPHEMSREELIEAMRKRNAG